jgi:hypothetical protein
MHVFVESFSLKECGSVATRQTGFWVVSVPTQPLCFLTPDMQFSDSQNLLCSTELVNLHTTSYFKQAGVKKENTLKLCYNTSHYTAVQIYVGLVKPLKMIPFIFFVNNFVSNFTAIFFFANNLVQMTASSRLL